MPDKTPRLAMVDFQDGFHPNPETAALSKLVPGGPALLYDHAGKRTSFPTWLATRRHRLKLNFAYDNHVRIYDRVTGDLTVTVETLPDGQYYIWIPQD